MEPTTTRLEGFLLSFKGEEISRVRKALADEGYTPDSDGLKQFILDELVEEQEPQAQRVGGMLGAFLRENPQVVQAGLQAVTGGLGCLFTKRRRR
jgi:hypothetical protein